MTALKLKGPKPTSMSIPVGGVSSVREVAVANDNLTSVLMRNSTAELGTYIIPDETTDLFRRRVVVTKQPKKKITNLDIPDISDVHETDMPWLGYVTHATSHRQFRNKFVLGAVVDIVRQIDGYLYSLTVQVPKRGYQPNPLRLVEIPLLGPMDTHHTVRFRKDITADDIKRHFDGVPAVPPSLIAEYTALGYVLEGNIFTHPAVKGYERSIMCELYGRIVTPIESLRSIQCSQPS